jgi:hypothetical protein
MVMSEQAMEWLYYVVFLAQVLLISYVLPRKVLDRLRFVVETYPPAQYPRLYPVTMDKVERAQRNYRGLNLFDFVSPAEICLAAVVYVTFVGLILYVGRFDFPWFGGNLNIAIVSAINIFFALVILNSLYGKKKDPFQAPEDRARQIGITIRTAVWTSILATIFIALNIGLGAFDLGQLKPIAFSMYIQLLALLSFRAYGIDNVNFEVYREGPVAA